jgi:hypothetical protein
MENLHVGVHPDDATWSGLKPTPVLVGFAPPCNQNRLTVAFRLILAIPHLACVLALSIVAMLVTVAGWFTALVLGRLPEGLQTFLAGVARYATRVDAYMLLLTDRYPPFALDSPDYPVSMEVVHSQLNRLAVLFRLVLIIPAYVAAYVISVGISIVAFFVWLIVLITGRMPRPLFEALSAALRYQTRCSAYMSLLTPAYPWGLFGDTYEAGFEAPPDAVSSPTARIPSTRLKLSSAGKRVELLFIILGSLGIVANTGGDAIVKPPDSATSAARSELRRKLIPPPHSYIASTGKGTSSGPITRADFDQYIATPGTAASFGLITGYDKSYQSTLTFDGIEILLFRFASSEGAAAFVTNVSKTALITELDHTQGTIPSVPGSLLVESSKPGNDGLFVHQIVAHKDKIVMAMQYSTNTAEPLPTLVADFATRQYERL